jgi:hypothetical protein
VRGSRTTPGRRMYSARQRNRDHRIDHRSAESDKATSPWADLQLTVPNDRSDESIVALVECALVELTHNHVGAVVVTHQVWDETHAVRRRRRRRRAVTEATLRQPAWLARDHRPSRDRS